MTRTGKIARLPRGIREQLNRHLQDGQPGVRLVEWLNALPEVQAVLAVEFGGRPVNEPNLTEWKQGGYAEWLAQQELVADARAVAEMADEVTAAAPDLTEHLAAVVTARYATALLAAPNDDPEETLRRLRPLRALCQNVLELRRGAVGAAWLKLERERFEHPRVTTEDEVLSYFLRWAEDPSWKFIYENTALTHTHRRRRLRALLRERRPGSEGDYTAAAEAAEPEESSQIKVNQGESSQSGQGG